MSFIKCIEDFARKKTSKCALINHFALKYQCWSIDHRKLPLAVSSRTAQLWLSVSSNHQYFIWTVFNLYFPFALSDPADNLSLSLPN